MQNYVHINYKLVRYISLARCRLLPSFPPSLLAPLPLFLSSVSLSDANRTAAMNVSPMICYSTAEEEEEEREEERKSKRCKNFRELAFTRKHIPNFDVFKTYQSLIRPDTHSLRFPVSSHASSLRVDIDCQLTSKISSNLHPHRSVAKLDASVTNRVND